MINELRKEKVQFALIQIIFGLCVIAFGSIIVSPNFSAKVFNVTGVVAFILLVFQWKTLKRTDASWLCLILFLIGACDLIWYRIYKVETSEAINSYRAYLEIGKICLFGSIIIFLFTNKNNLKIGNNKSHYVLAIIIQITTIIYAGYQHFFLGDSRVTLSLAGGADATGAAYTISFVSFYIILVTQHSTLKWKEWMILAHFFITFLVLIATETRAAILAYPIIFFGLLLFKFYTEKHIPWKGVFVFLLAFLAGSLMMKDSLIHRYHDFNNDIAAYDQNNSVTSFGARLAMWKTGLYAARDNYIWQSTDQRNQKIRAMIAQDKSLEGALLYMRGHLHNEVVETLSLKGPSGLVLYFLFIVSLGWYALRRLNSILLFALLVSIVTFGFSGVMFYSKTTPIAWMLTLIMSIIFLEQNKHCKVIK